MPKRFSFKYEVLLRLRKQAEEQQQRVVAARVREMTRVRVQVQSLNEQITGEISKFRGAAAAGALDVADLSKRRYWIAHLQHGVLETNHQLAGLSAKLDHDRGALAAAAKAHAIMRKLRDKALHRHQREMDRLETGEADELALCRYAHVQLHRQAGGQRS